MPSPTVVVVHDPNGRQFLLPIRISDSPIERLHPQIVNKDLHLYRVKLGETGFRLMLELIATGVVEDLYFYTHSFSVFAKEGADDFDMIERIVGVLKTRLGEDLRTPRLLRSELFPHHYHPEDSGHPEFKMPA